MAVDVEELEPHRAALTGHCYRMLGSSVDADDAVQETLVRAWRALERFDGRSSLKTWLMRIATHVCLDTLSDNSRRMRVIDLGPSGDVDSLHETRPASAWIEPIADSRVIPGGADPAEQLMLRQSVRVAFVAAIQTLPPKQRAALLLTEVLGWSANEVADGLDTSLASVNSALQRARATLASKDLGELRDERDRDLTDTQRTLVDRYCAAFERYDLDELASLLHEDATLSMPPYTLWFRGPATIRRWMEGPGSGCRGSRLVHTSASGAPAFAQYRPTEGGGHAAWALIVLDLRDEGIAGITSFLDVQTVFPSFGMPLVLDGSVGRRTFSPPDR